MGSENVTDSICILKLIKMYIGDIVHLELLGDKVQIVPPSVAEETGVERESDASWRCRRFLRKQLSSQLLSSHLMTNLHQLIWGDRRMWAGTDTEEDQAGTNDK